MDLETGRRLKTTQTAAEHAATEVAKAADTAASAASKFSLDQLSLDQLQDDEEEKTKNVNVTMEQKEENGKPESPSIIKEPSMEKWSGTGTHDEAISTGIKGSTNVLVADSDHDNKRNAEVGNLDEILQKEKDNVMNLQKQLQMAQSNETFYQAEMSEMKIEMSALNSKILEQEQLVRDKELCLSKVESALLECKNMLSDSEEKSARLEEANEVKTEIIRSLEEEKSSLHEKIEVLKTDVSRISSIQNNPSTGSGKKREKFKELLHISEEKKRSLEAKLESMEKDKRIADEELSDMKTKCSKLMSDLNDMKASFELDNSTQLKEISSLKAMLADEQSVSTNFKNECKVNREKISRLTLSLEESNEKIQQLEKDMSKMKSDIGEGALDYQKQITEIESELTSKDALVEEYRGKINKFTEKMKETVVKYAEEKKRSQAIEEENATLLDSIKSLQAKESKSLSMTLKFEAMESTVEEYTRVNEELAEKLSETKRELTRVKSTLQDSSALVEELQREIAAANMENGVLRESLEKVENSASSKRALELTYQERIQSLETQISDLTETFKSRENELILKAESILNEEKSKLNQVSDEYEELKIKFESREDSADALEEYKKRAQVALKKANAASATLTTEKTEILRHLKETEGRLDDAERRIDILQNKLKATEVSRDELEGESKMYKEKIKQLEGLKEDGLVREDRLNRTLEQERDGFNKEKESLKNELENAQMTITALSSSKRTDNVIMGKSATTYAEPENDGDLFKAPEEIFDKSGAELVTTHTEKNTSLPESVEKAVCVSPHAVKSTEQNLQEFDEKIELIDVEDGLQFKIRMPTSEQSLYINELYLQLEEQRKEISHRNSDLVSLHQELSNEKDEKRKLQSKVDELVAYVERNKTSSSAESAVNMEYLKNCIYRFMASTEYSEKMRLYPVVATILSFTKREADIVAEAIESQLIVSSDGAIADISAYAVTSFNEFVFGSSTSMNTMNKYVKSSSSNRDVNCNTDGNVHDNNDRSAHNVK